MLASNYHEAGSKEKMEENILIEATISLTSSGLESITFQLVAKGLNHLRVPLTHSNKDFISEYFKCRLPSIFFKYCNNI
jgi:hypothetical protein